MLQTIRDKTSGWVAGIFLAVIAVVFIFWGIDFQSNSGAYAAKVNGERVPAELVRRAWQEQQTRLQQMLRGELPEEMAKAQRQALLNQFIRTELLSQRAEELGYRVGDLALARRIMEFPQLQVDGKFSADRYSALLQSEGRSKAQFEEELRAELEIEQLQAGIIDSAFITPQEAQRRYALANEKRKISYAVLPLSNYLDKVQVTDAQIKAWYDSHQQDYQTPELVDLEYIEVTRADAEKQVKVDDAALRQFYDQVKERYESPERRRASHILIPVDDTMDDAAAQKLAQDVFEKAKAGGDFSALAKQYSKDPGSAAQGGDLGWAERGMFVGPFEDALFSMSAGEIRGPVKSEFGYHIIRLDDVEQGKLRSFEEVRAELEEEYRRDQAQSIFDSTTQALGDEAFAALTELQSVSEKLKLPVKRVNDFTRQGGGEFGNDAQVIEAAFSADVLESRQNSPLISLGADRALVLRVAEHEPSKPLPFDAVRAQIESKLRQDAAKDAASSAGQEALKRLRAGEAWSEVLAGLNAEVINDRTIERQSPDTPPQVTDLAFKASRPGAGTTQVAGSALPNGGYALVSVSEVTPGDPAAEPAEEKASRIARDARQKGNEEFAAYVTELEREADIERNPQIFD